MNIDNLENRFQLVINWRKIIYYPCSQILG